MMWGAHDGIGWGMGWWMLWGSIWFVVFWGIIIGLVVWVVNRLGGGRGEEASTPLEIARRRYARGEITKEEFDRLRHDLA